MIPDGIYFLYPAGCCWIGVEYRGGRAVGRIEQSDVETHRTAGDRYADVVPGEQDTAVKSSLAVQIIRDVVGDTFSPELYVVERSADD